MSTTSTLLGALRTEHHQYDEAEQTVAGPRNVVLRRPAGVGVRNDGFRGYWMAAGQTYAVAHDGTGWRVTCQDWTDGHVLRLVDAQDGRELVGTLPTDGEDLVLVEGRTYELREQSHGVWQIHQAA